VTMSYGAVLIVFGFGMLLAPILFWAGLFN
jgi:hypothetical protein